MVTDTIITKRGRGDISTRIPSKKKSELNIHTPDPLNNISRGKIKHKYKSNHGQLLDSLRVISALTSRPDKDFPK